MTGFNVVIRIWRDLPMLIWECLIFLESLGAGRLLTRSGSGIRSTKPPAPTPSQIANPNFDVGRAHFPASAGLPLARRSLGAEAPTVEQEIGGYPNRHFLNTDNWSFLVLRVWSLLLSVLLLQRVTVRNGIV
jgi:hypothetical protein